MTASGARFWPMERLPVQASATSATNSTSETHCAAVATRWSGDEGRPAGEVGPSSGGSGATCRFRLARIATTDAVKTP